MKYNIVVVAALLSFSAALNFQTKDELFTIFLKFTNEHSKVYASFIEFTKRFEIFTVNFFEGIEARVIDSESSFDGLSPFMDITKDEFKVLVGLGRQRKPDDLKVDVETFTSTMLGDSGDINYRDLGLVSPVKNQGDCGACWTFGATAAIESALAIQLKNQGKPISFFDLSRQQLVDCEKIDGDDGCKGGDERHAYTYLKTQGITTDDQYKYEAKNGTCRIQGKKTVAKTTGYLEIPAKQENKMIEALNQNGPLTIGINASVMQFYQKGAIIPANKTLCKDDEDSIDHTVVIVGVATNSKSGALIKRYWIIKNSWGAGWGDNGFFNIEEGKNACALALEPTFPFVLALN